MDNSSLITVVRRSEIDRDTATPVLTDQDFGEAVRLAEGEYNRRQLEVLNGS